LFVLCIACQYLRALKSAGGIFLIQLLGGFYMNYTVQFCPEGLDQSPYEWTIKSSTGNVLNNEWFKSEREAHAYLDATLGIYSAPVQDLPVGEYVRRKADSSKVYKRGAYDRSSRTYELEDCSDCSRSIYVKRGTILFYGFTY
jgi:hypothetical protein